MMYTESGRPTHCQLMPYLPIAVGPLTPRTPPIKILNFHQHKVSFSTHFTNYTSFFNPQKFSHEGIDEPPIIDYKI